MYDRETALNIFRPGDAIDDPEVFAGRKRHLLELTDALLVDGTIPIIYGERGLGKTSLALQVARIAGGDVTLLEEHGARSRALDKQRRTVPHPEARDGAPNCRRIQDQTLSEDVRIGDYSTV